MFSCRAAATFVCSVFQQLIHLSELHWQSGTFSSVCRWAIGLFVIRPPSLFKSVFFLCFLFWFEIRFDPNKGPLVLELFQRFSGVRKKKLMCSSQSHCWRRVTSVSQCVCEYLRGMRGYVAHLPQDNIHSDSASLLCLFKGASDNTVSTTRCHGFALYVDQNKPVPSSTSRICSVENLIDWISRYMI